MPTENRSSNTEMVSVQRSQLSSFIEHSMASHRSPAWVKDKAGLLAALAQPAEQHQGDLAIQKSPKSECPHCLGDRMFGCFECQPDDLSGDEEKQTQSAPYGWHVEWADSGDHYLFTKAEKRIEVLRLDSDVKVVELYTRADPGEVKRLREGISKHWKVICDQRAELETLRTQLQLMTGDYRTAIVNGHERITFLGGDCDSVDKMLADNPNYANARALLNRKP